MMCDGHKRCTRYPVYTVTIHPMDRCDRPRPTEYQLCPACVRAVAYRIAEVFTEIADTLPLTCVVCRRTVSHLHDLLDVEYVTDSAELRRA